VVPTISNCRNALSFWAEEERSKFFSAAGPRTILLTRARRRVQPGRRACSSDVNSACWEVVAPETIICAASRSREWKEVVLVRRLKVSSIRIEVAR